MNLFSSLTRLCTTTALPAVFVAAPMTLTFDTSGQLSIGGAAFANEEPPEGGPVGPGGPGGPGGFPGGEPGGPGGEPGGPGGEPGGTEGGKGGTGGTEGGTGGTGGTGGGGGTTPPDVTPTPVSQPASAAPEREAPGPQASAPAATPATPATPAAPSGIVAERMALAESISCRTACTRTVNAKGDVTVSYTFDTKFGPVTEKVQLLGTSIVRTIDFSADQAQLLKDVAANPSIHKEIRSVALQIIAQQLVTTTEESLPRPGAWGYRTLEQKFAEIAREPSPQRAGIMENVMGFGLPASTPAVSSPTDEVNDE